MGGYERAKKGREGRTDLGALPPVDFRAVCYRNRGRPEASQSSVSQRPISREKREERAWCVCSEERDEGGNHLGSGCLNVDQKKGVESAYVVGLRVLVLVGLSSEMNGDRRRGGDETYPCCCYCLLVVVVGRCRWAISMWLFEVDDDDDDGCVYPRWRRRRGGGYDERAYSGTPPL